MNEFKGRLYYEGASDPVAVSARLLNKTIILTSGDGETTSIPVREIDVEEGGDLGDRVKIHHRKSSTLVVFNGHEFLEHIEENCPNLENLTHSKKVKAKVKNALWLTGKGWGILVASVCGFVLVCYLSLDFFVNIAVDRIPPSVEEAIGSTAVTDKEIGTATKNKTKSQVATLKRIQNIGDKLVKASGNKSYKFKFFIRETDEVNAFAAPGGYLVVNTGLIDLSKSDDELAGVIGHEIGHVLHRDTMRRLLHSSGLGICLAIITGGTVNDKSIRVLIPALQHLENLSFSRNQEAAADKLSVELALKAGYKPDAMAALFKRMEKDSLGIPKEALALISSHPITADRIKAIQEEAIRKRAELGIPAQ